MPDNFDRIFNENLKMLAPKLLLMVMKKDFIPVRELDTNLKTTISRIPDFLHLIKIDGEEAIVHLEFQKRMSNSMTFTMMNYFSLLKAKNPKREIYQYVIYFGEENHKIKPEYTHKEGWTYRYTIINLKDIEYQLFYDNKEPELVLLSTLAKLPKGEEERFSGEIAEKIRNLVKDKDEFRVFLKQLKELARLRKRLKSFLIEKIERAMPIHFTKKDIDKMTKNDPLYEKGIERGVRKGFKKGIEKGKIESAKKLFLSGMSLELVQNITDLPLEKLKVVQKELGLV